MKDLNYILDCFNNTRLLETYKNYDNLWQENNRFPYLNYIGLNFNDKELVSAKFYFHIYHQITKKEASMFLPTLDDFNKYYHLYQEPEGQSFQHFGCAFSLKFFPKLAEPVQGFYLRVPPNEETREIIGVPKLIPYNWEEQKLYSGIYHEYYPEYVHKKKYFYFKDKAYMDFFANMFNHDFIKSASLAEYSESEKMSKINTWYGNDPEIFSTANTFSKSQNEIINNICQKYSLEAKAFGFYSSEETKSVYLFSNSFMKNQFFVTGETNRNDNNTIKHLFRKD